MSRQRLRVLRTAAERTADAVAGRARDDGAMRILVTAASRHGSTREIAAAIAEALVQRGHEAEACPIKGAAPEGYDAVVLGSAVYTGRWLKPARAFAERHAAELAARPVWLFSSGPLGPPEHLVPEGEAVDVAALMETTRARGHRVFAGRLHKPDLGFGERAMVAAVHAPEGDFRDWAAIDAWAGEIAAVLGAPVAA
jgi:menaquinone-dependent protoporphyrinogen oxidase